ncbi:MAG TPA: hypothetical protein VGB47_02655 [Thermoanaerobaculia bacterium]
MKAGTRCAIAIVALGAGGLVGAACGRARPVADLKVNPRTVDLPYPHVAPLNLRLRPTGVLDGLRGKPRVFVHVLDGGRRLLRTFDHPLPENWTPGRAQSYEIELYQSAIAERLPTGAYEMTFGLYDDSGKRRWPLAVDGEEVGRREYRLATLVVPAADGYSPSFEFTGAWLPVEPGSSKQVVARRCLPGEGAIAVVEPPSEGTVRLAASIQTSDGAAAGGAWRVSASCSPQAMEISGDELQWVGFPLTSAGEPPCEIRFTPPGSAGSVQPLCLEVLAWRPSEN